MLANWVKQGTSTTGTGAITLDGTPPSGYVAFSDVFLPGQVIQYVIEDGNNREVGIGTLSSGASWTLSRDVVIEKLEGGAFTRLPASGINLSGSAMVTVDASSLAFPFASARPFMSKATTAFHNRAFSPGARSVNANDCVFMPATLLWCAKYSGMQCEITTAAGTRGRMGVYTVGTNGGPHRLIAETVDFDPSTTGAKTASFASTVYLPPGNYWFAVAVDGAASFGADGGTSEPIGHQGTGSVAGNAPVRFIANLGAGWTNLPDPARSPSGNSAGRGVELGLMVA